MSNREFTTQVSSGKWKVHLPNLIQEALKNNGASVLTIPFGITGRILAKIGARAIELQDAELLDLCERLTIIERDDEEVEE